MLLISRLTTFLLIAALHRAMASYDTNLVIDFMIGLRVNIR